METEKWRSIREVWGQTIIETLNFHSWISLSLYYSVSVLIPHIPPLLSYMRTLCGRRFSLRAAKHAASLLSNWRDHSCVNCSNCLIYPHGGDLHWTFLSLSWDVDTEHYLPLSRSLPLQTAPWGNITSSYFVCYSITALCSSSKSVYEGRRWQVWLS